jgi:short-subunit dehydrogenase
MVTIEGSGVVVTGAGSGIGRAIARRLAAGGARVVVNDLDSAAAEVVAGEIGERGFAVAGDVGTELGVHDLVTAARWHLGEIDIYCSNAGTGRGTGPDTPESDWQQAWEVNLMAHVRASRELLPGWLDRGQGTFVVTASAAGLLTMLGSAPHRGLTVHCLCPQGVRTKMLADSGRAGEIVLRGGAIEPEQVADAVWDGLADGRFLILPHPEVHDYYALRAGDTDKWLRGMNRLQQKIEEAS